MITDEQLQSLIEATAADAPEPAPISRNLFRAQSEPAAARKGRRWVPRAALGAAALAVVCAIAVVVPGSQVPIIEWRRNAADTAEPAEPAEQVNMIGTADAAFPVGAPEAMSTAAAGAGAADSGWVPMSATDTARIIKTGSLEVEVGKGTVTESVNRLTALTTGLGGYLSETRTTATSDSASQATATISVRVPAAAFEQLLAEASRLGEVRSTTTSGQDVTAQFTDIDAQLNALTATRDQFLLVLGEATNVNDILAVHDRITQVQIQMDQLEGQKRLLTDQTSFGTLTVTLLEPGTQLSVPEPDDDPTDLGDAWRDARRNFGDAIETIVEASGTLAVVLLCGAVVFTGGWFILRSMRRRVLTL